MANILFIMKALFIGGAEKQYRLIMESLEDCCKITVILLNRPLDSQAEHTYDYIKNHKKIRFIQLGGSELNNKRKGSVFIKISKVRTLFLQYMFLKKFLRRHNFSAVMYSYVTQLLMTPLFSKYHITTIFNERNTGRQICDSYVKRSLLKKCNIVVSNSKYASNYIKKMTGINTRVIYNGLETKKIEKVSHDGFNILVPARITKIKNQGIVVDAIDRLADKKGIKILFAGALSEYNYYEEIKEKVDKGRINAEFLGYCDDMESLYAIADIVVLPSFEEGTPNVLLESYMYKIIPIVSNIPMNIDCCTNNKILFSPNDGIELLEKINEIRNGTLINNIESFLEDNYLFVNEKYGIERMKNDYKKLFDIKDI